MTTSSSGLDNLKRRYVKAKAAYYGKDGRTIMTDAEFDLLEDKIRKLDPQWEGLKKTGAPVADKKQKIALPFFMPSLGKVYPKDAAKWLGARTGHSVTGRPMIVMDKLDGSSLYLRFENGRPVGLITRGDGTTGKDISFLIPDLNIPNIPDKTKMEFRCEAVVSRTNFKRYAREFENSRQMVAGLLNRKKSDEPHKGFKAIDIVILGMFMCDIKWALDYARNQGLLSVAHKVIDKPLTPESLSRILKKRKEVSDYEIDGLVLAPEGTKMVYIDSDKPKWAVAFKDNVEDEAPETKVKQIIYQVSHHRRIIPKIEIEPVRLDGATVSFATCHNAKWMQDRGIGPGAVVKVLRSGGVIPKIVAVVSPGKFQPPQEAYKLEGVHFVLADSDNAEAEATVATKANLKFLNQFGVEGVALATIKLLYAAGCTSPFHYMKAAKVRNEEGLRRAGLGKVMAQNLMAELVRVFGRPVKLIDLMVASNVFGVGVGERRLKAIQASGLSMLKLVAMNKSEATNALLEIPGFQDRTAAWVVDGLPKFRKWLATAERFITVVDPKPGPKKVLAKGKLTGQRVSFTGYRSKEEEAAIEAAGGELVPYSLTKTTILLEGGKGSTKGDKAREKGIRVCSFADLKI